MAAKTDLVAFARKAKDGTGVRDLHVLPSGNGAPQHMAFDSPWIYFTDTGPTGIDPPGVWRLHQSLDALRAVSREHGAR